MVEHSFGRLVLGDKICPVPVAVLHVEAAVEGGPLIALEVRPNRDHRNCLVWQVPEEGLARLKVGVVQRESVERGLVRRLHPRRPRHLPSQALAP